LFAGQLLNAEVLYKSLLAFAAFSFTASVVYIINDIMDREKDRQHPEKCKRPIASGRVSVMQANIAAAFLLAAAAYISAAINISLIYILAAYFVMNLAYSVRLKHVVIIDVMIIALGFVLRAFAGIVATGIPATSWFVLCVFMLSLFLALAKRRNEMELLKDSKSRQRRVLRNYSIKLIDQITVIVAAVMIMSYALFASSAREYFKGEKIPLMMLTIPVVTYGIFRYLFLVHIKGQGERPEEVLLHDRHIMITVVIYVASIIFIRGM
jgi:4-hydroxybenzoate polyprenyltransferase